MLDPSEQTKLVQLLKHLQVERGMAMLFISHDLAIVLRVADRVVVLDEGRIVEEAPSTQLLTIRPIRPHDACSLPAAPCSRPGVQPDSSRTRTRSAQWTPRLQPPSRQAIRRNCRR
jgi:ABC-type glutathione transport system ATPase component